MNNFRTNIVILMALFSSSHLAGQTDKVKGNYCPFSVHLEEYGNQKTICYFQLKDTVTGFTHLLFSDLCSEFKKESSSHYSIDIQIYNPLERQRTKLMTFNIYLKENSYVLDIELPEIPDYSEELAHIVVDSANCEATGFKAIQMFLKTGDKFYFEVLRKSYNESSPTTYLTSYADLLWSLGFISKIHIGTAEVREAQYPEEVKK